MSQRHRIALGALLLLVACTSNGDDGLGVDAVDAVNGTEALLRAVATDGVQGDAATVVATRAAFDSPAVFNASFEFVDLVPRFLTEVLAADPATLSTLVAIGIDGLGQDIWGTTVKLASPTLPPDIANDEREQAFGLRVAAIDVDDYYRDLGIAGREAGIDEAARWGALRAVLVLAAATPPRDGSFIAELEDGALTTLAVDDDDEPAPDDPVTLIAAVDDELEAVLVAALYEEPAFRELIVGDVDLDTFAADPFVAYIIDPDGDDELGRRTVEALMALVDDDGSG